MAICANQGRMYMGTARQYMEKQCNCHKECSEPKIQTVRKIDSCPCEKQVATKYDCELTEGLRFRENGCQPESMCVDLPLAMAYMNPQPYTGLVNCDLALTRGSAFNNLYDPWKPGNHC